MNRLIRRTMKCLFPSLLALVVMAVGGPIAPAASAQTVESNEAGLTGLLVFQTSSGGGIYTINADGTGLRYLTNGLDPSLSPDGQWVAFSHWSDPVGLFVIRTDGTDERQILWQPQIKSPVWSPDGTRIAFSFQHEGQPTNWIKTFKMRVPGSDTKVTVEMDMPADPHWKIATIDVASSVIGEMYSHDYSFSPSWSADGSQIVYASDKGISLTWDGADSAVTRDPNTGRISDRRFVDRAPAWSPDGQRIVFQYRSHDHWEVMVMNADGSGRTLLTKSPTFAKKPISSVSPAWSPDGSHVAYLTDKNGAWEIWVMNADGSDERPMLSAETLAGVTFVYNNVDERVLSWSVSPTENNS